MTSDDHGRPKNQVDGRQVRLFVMRGSANSRLAERNLRAFLDQHPEFATNVEVVDVAERPAEALSAGVYVTPMLIRVPADCGRVAVGTLDNTAILSEILA